VLEVRDLVAGYGDKTILDGVSLTVDEGEIVVVLGGSGSGKSTLLRCVVGLLAPISGTVTIDGHDVHEAAPKERDEILRGVGMAFQSAALLNSLTCADNVALPIEEHWRLDHETARMVARMRLASVGLADAADALPSELSGGMRKRAGLARALALDPKLLLFDEPSAGLDPITARELDDLILTLRDRQHMSIVVVTHELGSINAIADRAVMLSHGKVLASGPLDEVRMNPAPEVQAFFRRETLPQDDERSLLDELEEPA
jgi:phospholipid/cholesterol/gamma-HCH transport system ATP-binding protein